MFTEGNLDLIDEVVTEDYVLHDPTVPEPIRGREAFKEYIQSFREAFPDIDATIEAIIAEDDLVAVRFTTSGTFEQPLPEFPDIEPTGQQFTVTAMEFDRIDDGKLAETWMEFDSVGWLQQLGVIPPEELPVGSTG